MPVLGDGSKIGITVTGQVTVANAGRDGAGTLATILAAGAYGSKVSSVLIISGAAIAAADVIRIFVDDGSVKRLIDEILVPITAPSTTVETWQYLWTPNNANGLLNQNPVLELPPGCTLKMATNNGGTYNTMARYQDI